MKRKIYVVDVHTHGYDATLRFIGKMNWKRRECEIVSCGSHAGVLKALSLNAGYGVVPVHNTNPAIGDIGSVTSLLTQYRSQGYEFKVKATLSKKINHYLMAPSHVVSVNELTLVISKEEALAQCHHNLSSLGLGPTKRSFRDSTGAAAREVSLAPAHVKIGAIAPKSAARAHDLRILVPQIQDDPKNTTTFHLLENRTYVRPLRVGIIGIRGRFGKVLEKFYNGLGCSVIGSDAKTPTLFTNKEVVMSADVVIFAIDILKTVPAIKEVLPYIRQDQLLLDITGVKGPAMKAMFTSKAQVVGLHPMFAPELPFEGQTIVVCPARLTDPVWKTWVVNMLTVTRCKLKWSTAEEHDAYMAPVQVLPQVSFLENAALITELGISTSESLTFTSPYFKIAFSMMGRLLGHDPYMYAAIFMENRATLPMLRKRLELSKRLIQIVEKKDLTGLVKLFLKARAHFGPELIREANELFVRMNSVTKTRDSKRSVILEFSSKDDRPGLLARVGDVFKRYGINITDFNSLSSNKNSTQFLLSLEQTTNTHSVRQALDRIAKWTRPHVKVIV